MKPFLDLDSQIELLKSRGLSIPDVKYARKCLLEYNYYRLSGYSLTLRKDDKFYPNVNFRNIMDIYLFDRAFRSILMHYLEIIEVKFKTSYAYYFSEYCQSGDCYTHIDCYTNFWEAVESLNSIMQTTKRLSNEEAYIKHHMVNKKEFPIWVLVESATFGGISKLYSHTRPEIQSKIADHFQYPGKKGPDILKSVIHRLAVLRNACAHESRLFNKPIAIKPPLMKADKKYLPDPRTGDAGVWGDILTMRRFLSQQEFSAMINNIKEIHRQYPFVAMEHYKFHPDWEVLFT